MENMTAFDRPLLPFSLRFSSCLSVVPKFRNWPSYWFLFEACVTDHSTATASANLDSYARRVEGKRMSVCSDHEHAAILVVSVDVSVLIFKPLH